PSRREGRSRRRARSAATRSCRLRAARRHGPPAATRRRARRAAPGRARGGALRSRASLGATRHRDLALIEVFRTEVHDVRAAELLRLEVDFEALGERLAVPVVDAQEL